MFQTGIWNCEFKSQATELHEVYPNAKFEIGNSNSTSR